jgi:hypothetical protein
VTSDLVTASSWHGVRRMKVWPVVLETIAIVAACWVAAVVIWP